MFLTPQVSWVRTSSGSGIRWCFIGRGLLTDFQVFFRTNKHQLKFNSVGFHTRIPPMFPELSFFSPTNLRSSSQGLYGLLRRIWWISWPCFTGRSWLGWPNWKIRSLFPFWLIPWFFCSSCLVFRWGDRRWFFLNDLHWFPLTDSEASWVPFRFGCAFFHRIPFRLGMFWCCWEKGGISRGLLLLLMISSSSSSAGRYLLSIRIPWRSSWAIGRRSCALLKIMTFCCCPSSPINLNILYFISAQLSVNIISMLSFLLSLFIFILFLAKAVFPLSLFLEESIKLTLKGS